MSKPSSEHSMQLSLEKQSSNEVEEFTLPEEKQESPKQDVEMEIE